MKRLVYKYPKSSFLSIDKDMNMIITKVMSNKRIKKLLYYTTQDALTKPDLTQEQTIELIGKNIKNVPKLYVDGSVLNYVIINMDNFTPSSNPEFRNCVIEFDIVCHFDQWNLKDFQLRPYKIAAEIDSMFDNRRLTGIGRLNFIGANQILLTDEYAGVCLMYAATHGGEDEQDAPKPADDADLIENYDEIENVFPWQIEEEDG